MTDKKIELIQQMLAKAESTTPEEAEALMEHAERLMIKYGIEQAQVDARRAKSGQSSEKIIQKAVPFKGLYKDPIALGMAYSVSIALGNLRFLQMKMGNTTYAYLIGFESDVEQAELLIRSLEVQAIVAMTDWWKGPGKREYGWMPEYDKRQARGEFIRGFGNGAAARIRESRATIIEESSTGTDLVLVDRKAQVDAFVDRMNVGKGRATSRRGYGSHSAGAAAGRQANTGGRALGNTKAIGR
jgi:hypothetical protein